MAEIEMVYQVGYCQLNEPNYCSDCHEETAEYIGCKSFLHSEAGKNVIPYGDCSRAVYEYRYKGWSGKNYEISKFSERYRAYGPIPEIMIVTIGNNSYDCVKVTLNGKCIFNVFDDEKEEE